MGDDSDQSKSLASAVDVIKATLAIATGTLVFSASLLKEQITFGCAAKWLLGISWSFLGVSIIAGTIAQLRVPVMISEGKPDIADQWFKIPGTNSSSYVCCWCCNPRGSHDSDTRCEMMRSVSTCESFRRSVARVEPLAVPASPPIH